MRTTMSTDQAVTAIRDLRTATGVLPDVLEHLTDAASNVQNSLTSALAQALLHVADARAAKVADALRAFETLEALVARLETLEHEIKVKTNEKKVADAKAHEAWRGWMEYPTTVAKHESADENVLGARQREALAEAREKIEKYEAAK